MVRKPFHGRIVVERFPSYEISELRGYTPDPPGVIQHRGKFRPARHDKSRGNFRRSRYSFGMNSSATSPEILEVDSVDGERQHMIEEIINLRRVLSDLNDQREDDRRSLLILQSQIDSMRDAKCSDSFEASLKNAAAICCALWNQVPSFPVQSLLQSLRPRKKKGGKMSSRSSVSSKKVSSSSSATSYRSKSDKPAGSFEVHRSLARDT